MYQFSSKLAWAEAYVRLGFKVFPCRSVEDSGKCTCGKAECNGIGKHPLTAKGVKDATDDPEKLKQFFTGAYEIANIGIATGEPSGIVVLDVDDPKALETFQRQHGSLPKTPSVETGSGRHFYFIFDERCSPLKNSVKFSGGLDVRTSGGYVVAPPSVHASGKGYRWIVSPDECEFARLPDWLFGVMPKHEDARAGAFTVEPAIDDVERARRYLGNTPPAVSGKDGHKHTFRTVCRLCLVFPSLDDDTLLDVLSEWNERCVPPWTEKELVHKIEDARKRSGDGKGTGVAERPVVEVVEVSEQCDEDDDDEIEWPTLHPDAYYGIAGEFVKRIEPESEADPVALLVTLLNGFGSIVGRESWFVAGGERHHVNTSVCVVGDSSRARKGTSRAYVKAALVGVDEAWDKRRVNGLSSGEGVIAAVSDDDVNEPGSFSIPDKRLWIVETEFGGTLRVLKREGNTLTAVLRNAWDGGTLSVMTRNRPLIAYNAHVSILAHVTIDELVRTLADVDVYNGFANRFLWILSRRSKLLPSAGTVDVDDLRNRLREVTQLARSIGEMQRSDEAERLWISVYPELTSEKRGTGGRSLPVRKRRHFACR
jgi:hypothetical protein